MKIYKYTLVQSANDMCALEMPVGAKVLNCIEQQGEIVLYALVDTRQTVMETRVFRVAGTGHPISGKPSDYIYVATVSFLSAALVFHVLELLNIEKGGYIAGAVKGIIGELL